MSQWPARAGGSLADGARTISPPSGRAAPGTRRRLRILHVVDSLGIGGIERNLIHLVEQTHGEMGHEICCVRQAGPLAASLGALGARIHVVGGSAGPGLSRLPRLLRLCRRTSPDVVHARNWGTIEAIFAARIARVPVVIYGEHGPQSWSGVRRDWGRRAVAAVADAMVANSDAVRDYLRHDAGVPADTITVIRNGVDTERFHPRSDRARLRRGRDVPPEALVIGGVGRLQPVKCYDLLIAAFQDIARRHPDSRLVLVGDGPERERLQGAIRSRGLEARARITGLRDDVAEWLAVMDIFAHVSAAEGSSNAILQAMAVGLPVVATGLAANREAVIDGTTGRLIETGKTAELVDALSAYCADDAVRGAHGAAGRRRVEAEFPLQQMIQGYRSLYLRLTAGQ